MKVTKVAFRMLRVHAQYENNAAEVEVLLDGKDTVEDAFKTAKVTGGAHVVSIKEGK